MSAFSYSCCDELRRNAIAQDGTINGIDYLEVLDQGLPAPDRQKELLVHLVNPVILAAQKAALTRTDHLYVDGGVRITGIRVTDASFDDATTLRVTVNARGDFSTYVLRISDRQGRPLDGMDPVLSRIGFSFKIECPSDFDCAPPTGCAPSPAEAPEIDYLAKDYNSFRALMLERLSLVLPAWQERSTADLGIALVEALAYVGDHLSYRQDVIAAEAYLGTARRRTSIRRHVALLDYRMHDGCNARALVQVQVTGTVALAAHTPLFTRLPGYGASVAPGSAVQASAIASSPEFFGTMADATLYGPTPATTPDQDKQKPLNRISFYAWGERRCCLPKAAVSATLAGDLTQMLRPTKAGDPGDLLVFEEIVGPVTGRPQDADPSHRHAVRLTLVEPDTDPLWQSLTGGVQKLTHIEWSQADALPFSLCISAVTDEAHGALQIADVSVARGNIVLVDHGLTLPPPVQAGAPFLPETLPAIPTPDWHLAPAAPPGDCCTTSLPSTAPVRYRPRLKNGPVTQAAAAPAPLDPAASIFAWDMDRVLPAVTLSDDNFGAWNPVRDLLESDGFATDFVVEVDDDGFATLRFGDDQNGLAPGPGMQFSAIYRVGNATPGNVGAEAIAHAITSVPGIIGVRNPMAARGGVDPEDVEKVRGEAPAAFRVQERAVIPDDYAAIAERHPEVLRAAATLRWTGSWYTVFVTVDRQGGIPVDAAFEAELGDFIEPFRMAGQDVAIDGPLYVALEIDITVCVLPDYFQSAVEQAILDVLSSVRLHDGSTGYFYPDNFSFAAPVYLSPIYQVVQAVPGVAHLDVTGFGRQGGDLTAALPTGVLTMGRLEIARLANDPSQPEQGVIRLTMVGGR